MSADGPVPLPPRRARKRYHRFDDVVLWALAVMPWSAVAQLLALVVTCRLRAGSWPRPYVPDVDSVALPGQQALWALSCVAAFASLIGTPIGVLARKLAGRRPLWLLVPLNVVGFVALMWIVRQDVGKWAWD